MSQSADAMHRDHVATARARIAERIVDGDARAHERPGFLGRQFVSNRRHRFRWCDHVFGISTVEIDAGDLTINAHGEISALALRANETMSAVPAHTDTLTFLPFDYVLADRIDASSDFMTRHTRILNSRPQTLFDVYVAVANPTRIIFILIKCLRFSFAPSWLSHFHRNLFHLQKLHREICRCSKLCHFSLRTFVELKPFAKDTVEHSRRNEAVQPTQHHAFAYRVMQTR